MNRIPTNEEWNDLFEISKKQALAGICGHGLQILYKDPKYISSISNKFLLQWLGFASVIKEENQTINKRCVKLILYFQEQGFNFSIFKGQGITVLYRTGDLDLRLLRQSGDIDLWIGGGREIVILQLNTLFKELDSDHKHAQVPFNSDTEVEVHWIPVKLMKRYFL